MTAVWKMYYRAVLGNYAVHGYPDVPVYPASHGCIRISNADAPTVFAWIAVGDPIYVYV